jgi:hypothetical protein
MADSPTWHSQVSAALRRSSGSYIISACTLPLVRKKQKMAARVGGYPGGYVERFVEPYNMDPGVYEPECDWQEEQPAYPDTQQFLDQIQACIT